MIIFDVEASGLHSESYPIEIAWQDSEEPDNFDCFLIQPASNWMHWDEYAETEIHHISRDTLNRSGISITDACARLNASLDNKTIYSDAIKYDQRWMMRLFNEASLKPTFSFGSVFELLPKDSEYEYSHLLENAPIKHRALDDARQIAAWMKHLLEKK